MDGDFTSQEMQAPAPDIWRLPAIESVKVVRVLYRKPVQYAEGASRKEVYEAIEFQVTTSADFPIRALAPARTPSTRRTVDPAAGRSRRPPRCSDAAAD